MQSEKYTEMENRHLDVIKRSTIDPGEFDNAVELFEIEPYPSVKMSPADRAELKQLLPGIKEDLVRNAEVKAREGACSCGRILTLLDSVAFTLGKSHSAVFLTNVLNGSMGKLIICAAELSDEFKRKLPKNTIFIADTTHIPCKDCGKAQALIVKQENMLHWWDGKS